MKQRLHGDVRRWHHERLTDISAVLVPLGVCPRLLETFVYPNGQGTGTCIFDNKNGIIMAAL